MWNNVRESDVEMLEVWDNVTAPLSPITLPPACPPILLLPFLRLCQGINPNSSLKASSFLFLHPPAHAEVELMRRWAGGCRAGTARAVLTPKTPLQG